MIVNFKSLNKNSRVWIFQSLDFIDDRLVEVIKEKISLFLNEWKSHQNNLNINEVKVVDGIATFTRILPHSSLK